MKQILIKKGHTLIEDVPAPQVSKGTVLVQVSYSCISIGTEISSVSSSGKTLFDKVLNQPEKITKAIGNLKSKGIVDTVKKIQSVQHQSDSAMPTGYSASGIVIDVGPDIKNINIGEKVACAGAGIANHAEYIEVPINLLVKIPDEVELDVASTVTLGSIAMQGVRRADVRLGENIAVIGLGILGQLTVQLLKASGCRVIGTDMDKGRIDQAVELGMDKGVDQSEEDVIKAASDFSNGFGVDTVIITAATSSKEPLSQAFKMCRKKGRVVLVGVVDMTINREDMYTKELDFLISTSYGPGRYDERYEEKGKDYPYAYVRWTENRNMQEYLSLIADHKIDVRPLIEKEYNIEDAPEVYEKLKTDAHKPLIILLKYDQTKPREINRRIEAHPEPIKKDGKINIALIGAGNYAKSMHLPNLIKLKNYYNIYAVAGRKGSNAKSVAQKFGIKYALTDYKELLEDKNVDAVIISTRHDLHAKLSMECLLSGKAVFLEKPMALNKKEMDDLVRIINEKNGSFLVGFNRRFSKYAREVKRHISGRINPMIINYQMNAGYIPIDHWVHTEEGGGRIIGEACHIFDLFNYFTESEVVSISIDRITPKSEHVSQSDNAVITLKYADGSVCTLTYTALGNNQYPKEFCQIYFDEKIIIINDYKKLEGYGLKLKEIKSAQSDKGQMEQMVEFAKFLKGEIQAPIPLWQMIQATEASFRADNILV